MNGSDEIRLVRAFFGLVFAVYFLVSLRDIYRYGIRRRFDLLPGHDAKRPVHDEDGLAGLITRTRAGTAVMSLALATVVLFTDTPVWIPAVAFPVIVLVASLVFLSGSRRYMDGGDPGGWPHGD